MDNKFSNKLYVVFSKCGSIIPENGADIEHFEKLYNKYPFPELKDENKNPSSLIGKKIHINGSPKKNNSIDLDVMTSMNMAARNGNGKLTEEILKKMHENRDRTED